MDIAVVGAGPVGACFAILAAQRGFSTLLIDGRAPESQTREDTRTFAVVRGSWRLLGAVGVHAALADLVEPLNGLEAIDGGTHWFGSPHVAFTADDLEADEGAGPLGQMVPAGALQAALDDIAGMTPGLTWLKGARFKTIEPAPSFAKISLEDGRTIHAGLVAASDGVNSPVRNALKIKTEGRAYGRSVFAANVRLETPHNGIARQLFTPEGPFATLPMKGDRANIAWYMKTEAAKVLAALPADQINAELNARFAAFAGKMILDGPAGSYPLILQIAESMIGPRTALLGDAARRINPLAGQGLNLGFKDVGALIDIISDARRVGLDPGADTVLISYQNWRRFDANTTALFIDVVDRIFSNDSTVLKPLRGLALTLANRVPPLRRAMTRQASAEQSSLPSLMR